MEDEQRATILQTEILSGRKPLLATKRYISDPRVAPIIYNLVGLCKVSKHAVYGLQMTTTEAPLAWNQGF